MSCIVDWAVNQVVAKPVVLAVVWTVAGALIRTMQSLVLRRRINRARWQIFASILGVTTSWAIGWAVGWVSGWAIGSAVGGARGETPVGMEEWFVLRRQIYQDSWWILASIVGWSLGLALAQIMEWLTLREATWYSGRWVSVIIAVGVWSIALSLGLDLGSFVGFLIDSTAIVAVVGLLIGWALVGAIAGSLVLWLLRRK